MSHSAEKNEDQHSMITRSRSKKTSVKRYTSMPDGEDVESVDSELVPALTRTKTDRRKSSQQPDPNMISLDDVGDEKERKRGLQGEYYNICLLTFLYVLQGIPLGLSGAVPYLLSSRKVTYSDQAIFSFVYWPFSVKLLWAPIVDSVYFSAFGRRKSWLVPVQYLLGFFMLFLSFHVSEMLGEHHPEAPVDVKFLTAVFFVLNFLAATQDIAVDGWALTMLSRRNVGYASTCNTVGQTAGYFLGYVVFLALESADFCNEWFRAVPSKKGMLTLEDFMYFWGIVFLITTTFVMCMKSETDEHDPSEQGVIGTYKQLWKIVQLPAVISLIGVLLTAKIGFAAADAVTGLKLIEQGVPRDRLALLGIPMIPIQIILPILISKYTAGPKPMLVFLRAMPFRLLMGLEFALVVYWAPSTKLADGHYPVYFYSVVLASYALHQVFLYPMFVAVMGFFAQISDPAIGGTYMTLLNTITNLGGNWPATVSLWLVDPLTWRACAGSAANSCYSDAERQACKSAGGVCGTTLDGYFILSIGCAAFGLFWLRWKGRTVRRLQDMDAQEWTCS